MDYYVVYAFPIAPVYEQLRKHLPPWTIADEHTLISAVIRRWVERDITLPLPRQPDQEQRKEWSDLYNQSTARSRLYHILNGPLHPAWCPQFHDIPDTVRITPRTLYLRYRVPAPSESKRHGRRHTPHPRTT